MNKTFTWLQSIMLEKTACIGSYPVYLVDITANGCVTYRVEKFVEVVGIHSWNIDLCIQ